MANTNSQSSEAAKPFGFSHGKFAIEVFSDGFITLPAEIHMPQATDDVRKPILEAMGGDQNSAPYYTNLPLIRTETDLILVDTGSGTHFQPTAGKLAANLKANGVDPNSITKVIFTHAHPDHAGGTVAADGNLVFPNATYYVSAAEWDFWCDKNFELNRPSALHDFARGSQRDLGAVEQRLVRVRPGDEIVSGIQVLETGGHTPGHISLDLQGEDHLIIAGDAASNWIVSFQHPDWAFGFDFDHERAVRNRTALIDRAAHEKTKLLGYHWRSPGYGYAERVGQTYRFVPA